MENLRQTSSQNFMTRSRPTLFAMYGINEKFGLTDWKTKLFKLKTNILFSDQKVSHLTLDTRLDSHYSQPGTGSSFGTLGTNRLQGKEDGDRYAIIIFTNFYTISIKLNFASSSSTTCKLCLVLCYNCFMNF